MGWGFAGHGRKVLAAAATDESDGTDGLRALLRPAGRLPRDPPGWSRGGGGGLITRLTRSPSVDRRLAAANVRKAAW